MKAPGFEKLRCQNVGGGCSQPPGSVAALVHKIDYAHSQLGSFMGDPWGLGCRLRACRLRGRLGLRYLCLFRRCPSHPGTVPQAPQGGNEKKNPYSSRPHIFNLLFHEMRSVLFFSSAGIHRGVTLISTVLQVLLTTFTTNSLKLFRLISSEND